MNPFAAADGCPIGTHPVSCFFYEFFTLEVLITIISSFIGVWAAFLLVDNQAKKQRLHDEIKALNNSILIISNAFNYGYVYLTQRINPSISIFETNKAMVIKAINNGATVDAQLSLSSMPEHKSDISRMIDLVTTKTDTTPRGLALAMQLEHSLTLFIDHMKALNNFIEDFKQKSPNMNEQQRICLYFGLNLNGDQNTMYRDLIYALKQNAEDILWFSKEIIKELTLSAEKKSRVFPASQLRTVKIDYPPEAEKVIPADDEYKISWIDRFN